MATWIALLRGINVGGNNILPMADLRNELSESGFANARTYIQSGNVVFESTMRSSAAIAKKIAELIQEHHGFLPSVIVLKSMQLTEAIKKNPFPNAVKDPKSLHFSFLESPARKADLEKIESIRAASEKYQLIKQVFYLHAPDGIGRSKLAANAEKCLGVSITGRNYRTLQKIREMISSE